MKKTLILLGILTTFFPLISFAVSPQTSSNWELFKGNTSYMINNNYASIIYDTDNDGSCEISD
jgi:hypothetical protein